MSLARKPLLTWNQSKLPDSTRQPAALHRPRSHTEGRLVEAVTSGLCIEVQYSYELILQAITTTDCLCSVSRYKYRSIPKGSHIRCFDLLPGLWDDPIRGHLSARLIGEAGSYAAVSYTWGSDDTKVTIDCDGCGLDAKLNLAILLRRLRSPADITRLWVDALCINQSDECERSDQVRLMDSVYRSAGSVIIWLGEEEETTAEAFSLLEELREVFHQSLDEYLTTTTYETLSASKLPQYDEPRWDASETLLNNSWFSRTWVLQEASLNKCTWIQQGGHTIEWLTLRRVILGVCVARMNILYHINISASQHMAHACSAIIADPSAWPLHELLGNTEWTSSSQDVDKVFGLVGLASDQQTVKHLVDYTCDATALYRKVALTYLLDGDLKMLNSASDHSFAQYTDLPTWVPDWSSWPRASSLGIYFRKHGGPPRTQPAKLPTVSPDGSRLTVSGQFTDRVVAIGRHLPILRETTDRALVFIFLESWRRLAHRYLANASHSTTTRATGVDLSNPIDAAFASLLTLDCPLAHMACTSYTDTYSRLLEQTPRHLPRNGGSVQYTDVDVFRYLNRMLTSCRKRTFFVTEQGFMGLGPYFLRPGDRMVQLDGGWTPMAVRRKLAGCFELIGEAYVPGLMKGGCEGEAVYEDICLVCIVRFATRVRTGKRFAI